MKNQELPDVDIFRLLLLLGGSPIPICMCLVRDVFMVLFAGGKP